MKLKAPSTGTSSYSVEFSSVEVSVTEVPMTLVSASEISPDEARRAPAAIKAPRNIPQM
ncbi:MAG: hypothetical protein AB3K77_03845 [Methanosarcinaceae archaeon]